LLTFTSLLLSLSLFADAAASSQRDLTNCPRIAQGKLLYCHPPPVGPVLREVFARSVTIGGQGSDLNIAMLKHKGELVEDTIAEEDESKDEEETPTFKTGSDIVQLEFDVKRKKLFSPLPDIQPEDYLLDAQKSTPETAKDLAARYPQPFLTVRPAMELTTAPLSQSESSDAGGQAPRQEEKAGSHAHALPDTAIARDSRTPHLRSGIRARRAPTLTARTSSV
jgi:hypothetical protein